MMIDGALGLFPGQGSQQVGMGQELYESLPLARKLFEAADKALGFSLSEICFAGPEDRLKATEVVQPAILTVSTCCFRLAQEVLGGEFTLRAAAGHSLGEYSALVAGGAIEFSDAVVLVHKRGRYMQEAVPAGQGAMLAVLGKSIEEIEAVLDQIAETAEIANINGPGQIVVSGSAAGMQEFRSLMPGTRIVELPVSAPFHCSLMQPAAEKLARDLDELKITESRFTIYANSAARPVQSPEQIRQALKDQVCGRVRWTECMTNALADCHPTTALEFGAGSVLSNLLKRIDRTLPRRSVSSAADLEELR